MADEKDRPQAEQKDAAKQSGPARAQARADEAMVAQSKENAAADDTAAVVSVDPQPLAGVPTFEKQLAGGEAAHEVLIGSDPYAHEAEPGNTSGVRTGAPPPQEAADAMAARARAGVPEPPKAGPLPTVSVYDTPGGYVTVPAGMTPEEYAAHQSRQGPGYAVDEAGFDTGAEVRHVAGPGPGSKD